MKFKKPKLPKFKLPAWWDELIPDWLDTLLRLWGSGLLVALKGFALIAFILTIFWMIGWAVSTFPYLFIILIVGFILPILFGGLKRAIFWRT